MQNFTVSPRAVTCASAPSCTFPKPLRRSPEGEVKLLLIEPRGVLNTGHESGERTAENDVWI
jgi:hypothetical protein